MAFFPQKKKKKKLERRATEESPLDALKKSSLGGGGTSNPKLLEALSDGPLLRKGPKKTAPPRPTGLPNPPETAMQIYEREHQAQMASSRMNKASKSLSNLLFATRKPGAERADPHKLWLYDTARTSYRPDEPRFPGRDAHDIDKTLTLDKLDLYKEERGLNGPGIKSMLKLEDHVSIRRGAHLKLRQKFNILDLEDKENMMKMFREYDNDGNFVLDRNEFKKLRKELGIHLTFDEIDRDGSGEIDIDELMAAISIEATRLKGRPVEDKKDEEVNSAKDSLEGYIEQFDNWLYDRMYYGSCLHRRPPLGQ